MDKTNKNPQTCGWGTLLPGNRGTREPSSLLILWKILRSQKCGTCCTSVRSLRTLTVTRQFIALETMWYLLTIFCVYLYNINQDLHMKNKKQKMQVTLGIVFAVLFIIWLFLPVSLYSKILGLTSNALGVLSMVLSYRAEEKNKKESVTS